MNKPLPLIGSVKGTLIKKPLKGVGLFSHGSTLTPKNLTPKPPASASRADCHMPAFAVALIVALSVTVFGLQTPKPKTLSPKPLKSL